MKPVATIQTADNELVIFRKQIGNSYFYISALNGKEKNISKDNAVDLLLFFGQNEDAQAIIDS